MIIDGIEVSKKIKTSLRTKVESLRKQGSHPCLATILVGDDPASSIYVKNKHKACFDLGIDTNDNKMESSITETELLKKIGYLNNDDSVHGILLQLPLPSHINQFKAINTIDPSKDVDGLTYYNAGLLFNKKPSFIPCTPLGIIELFNFYNIDLKAKDIVIINRSILVGKPLSLMLIDKDATVTVCHSQTKFLKQKLKEADIVITAVGNRKRFTLKSEFVKDGVVIIDVGISRLNGQIVGDTDFESVLHKASWITPVPGGVGPMTITMLLNNTIEAAINRSSHLLHN
ncbi:MAG: bifunctional 5,10-methylenetetrahydrofolate dehydrogenase/5,10-methenyltetrahydrofolate cyclohydrolase [Nitrososphaeraceae archaeon]